MSLRSIVASGLLFAACGPSPAPPAADVAAVQTDASVPPTDATAPAPAAGKGMPSTYEAVVALLSPGAELAGVRRARAGGATPADAEAQGRDFVVRADLDGNKKDDLALIAEGAPSAAGTVTRTLMVFVAGDDGAPKAPLSVDFGEFPASAPEPMSLTRDGAVLKIGRITGQGAELRNERFDIAWLDDDFVFVGYQALLPGEGERVPYAVDLTTGKGKRGNIPFEAQPVALVKLRDFAPGLDLKLTPKVKRTPLWAVLGGHMAAQDRMDEPLPMPVDGAVRVFDAGKQVCLAKAGAAAAVDQKDLVAEAPSHSFRGAALTASEGDCKGGIFALPAGAPEPWVYRAEPMNTKLRVEALAAARAHGTWQREQAEFAKLVPDARFEDYVDIGALAALDSPAQGKEIERKQKAITVDRLVPNDPAAGALVLVSADWARGHYGGSASIIFSVGADGELTAVASLHAKVDGVIDLERDGKPELYTTMRCLDAVDEIFAWDESSPRLPSAEEERDDNDRRATKLVEAPFICGD